MFNHTKIQLYDLHGKINKNNKPNIFDQKNIIAFFIVLSCFIN